MKRDAKRFLLGGILGAIALALAGIALLWVFDNLFNGSLLDLLSSFVSYVDNSGGVLFSRGRLNFAYLLFMLIFSAMVAGTGALCAYRTYKKQHALLLRAEENAARATELATREMERKSDLITYLAHDLKTPLASVVAYLSLLSEAPDLPPEQRAKYVGIALDKAYRLEQLIGELFEIIRFNLQTIAINEERINLKLMLEQLADEFYPLLLQQNKRISVSCEEGLQFRGDSDKLARVFNNILKNAAAYSYEGCEIDVAAWRAGERIEITFANQGNPIPRQKQETIFEKFYRLDTARSSQTGGAGLGLAIAKEIVEAHGGRIGVKSDSAATVFTVQLPLSPGHSPCVEDAEDG